MSDIYSQLRLAWLPAIIGGVIGLVMQLVFILFISNSFALLLLPAGEIVVIGMLLLLQAILRVIVGMWTAMLARRWVDYAKRSQLLPTAVVAGVIGWAAYTMLVIASWIWLRTSLNWTWLFLNVLQWVAEFMLGAILVSPSVPDPLWARKRGMHA